MGNYFLHTHYRQRTNSEKESKIGTLLASWNQQKMLLMLRSILLMDRVLVLYTRRIDV